MLCHVLDDVKETLKDQLTDADGNISEIDIDQYFDTDPFLDLDTEYKQSKFYREHFNLIVSNNLLLQS